eukprot:1142672-Pelagomonas_calceolata.AAC.12
MQYIVMHELCTHVIVQSKCIRMLAQQSVCVCARATFACLLSNLWPAGMQMLQPTTDGLDANTVHRFSANRSAWMCACAWTQTSGHIL